MDSLVGYGSDDENESERYGSQQASVGAGASCSFRRRDDDTNYDDVNMDMSEDSQDAESEPELPPAEPPSPQQPSRDQRRGSNDSRERDRERDREFDRKERRRESPGRSRSDRERSDRRSPRRDERYRSDRDRTGSRPEPRRGLLGDRPDDKVPALMDLKPFAGDLPPASDKRSQDARDAVSPSCLRFMVLDKQQFLTLKTTLLNCVSVLENEDGSSSRKTMKTATNKNLEDAVFKWFLQQRSMGNPISGPILCEKAKILAEKLGYSSFKASNGWLRNFKFRHGVRELDLAGEKLSADSAAAENFIEKFKTASESYDPEFVYNADETGLVWKALPKTTLASKRESSAPGHKVSKERVTVLNCANSTGNHKLPLLLIGKSRNPRAFKNVKKLPLFYKSQPKAWMTAALFTEWYDEVFIPEVKKHQKSVGKEGSKVLLIVDNAPTHPTAELLERENGQFKTTFLPPNVTGLLQPMDQSVIETMKRHYRRQLLRKLLIEGAEDEELVLANHSKINLKDCCNMVAEAWSLVTAVTLRRAWNKLKGLPSEKNKKKESEENEKQEYGEDDDDKDAFVDRDRRDRDRDRERERDRDRHGRRSEEKRSSSHRHDRRDRSRSRSRGAPHSSSHSSGSSERRSPSGDYRPSSYKVNKKLEVMEKMGLQIKTPDGSMATAQQLRAAAHDAPSTTSGGLPSYYNPSAVNASKILNQVQKRKLLWGNKNKTEAEEAAKWSGTRFAQDTDGKQVTKFMRLMGIKEPAAVNETPDKTADPIKKQEDLFQAMQAQYEVARATTHTMRGVGLGFQRGQY
ncbi:unnamed protein product [Arctia plantaginis]|uniref:HTH CENPB-type domain-containing protein n=1 Tax=Arctia plantaginis TaxID=874455 RepID=A0A8S0YMI7_ARCPL|nr:unnamed protein product [Arctia plantaginis]